MLFSITFVATLLFHPIAMSEGVILEESLLAARDKTATKEIHEVNPDIIRDVVQGQINAILADDIPRAYFNFTSRSFREKTTLDKFTQFVRQYSNYWNNSSFDWDTVRLSENIAIIRGTLSSDRVTKQATFFLMTEGNQWKVMGITIRDLPAPPNTEGNIFQRK